MKMTVFADFRRVPRATPLTKLYRIAFSRDAAVLADVALVKQIFGCRDT
jgi:hypothetical protein